MTIQLKYKKIEAAPVKKAKREFPGLLEYLESRLGKCQGHGQERHFFCPFCIDRVGSESNKRKLDINVSSGKSGCYRCEYRAGGLEKLFRDMNGGALRLDEARLVYGRVQAPKTPDLADTVRATLREEPVDVRHLKPVALPREYVKLTSCTTNPNARTAFRYLTKRGAGPELIEAFQIGYAWSGRYAMRLIFPVILGGKVIYWTTRYAGDHAIKSLNPDFEEGYLSKEEILFNYDACVGHKRIAVVEGPFSAMAFHPPELECPAVATFGKSPSARQLAMIEGMVKQGLEEVVIGLDPDAATKIDFLRNALADRVPEVTVLKLGHGDPWDRRADLPELLADRGEMSLAERVRGRFLGSK